VKLATNPSLVNAAATGSSNREAAAADSEKLGTCRPGYTVVNRGAQSEGEGDSGAGFRTKSNWNEPA
jgi:hypothetical protein